MNAFRLSFYFALQICIGVRYEKGIPFIIIELPFFSTYISLSKDSTGVKLPWIK